MRETTILVVDPDASISIRDDGNHHLSPRFPAQVRQAAIFEQKQPLRRREPDSILSIAKQRSHHPGWYSRRSTHSAISSWTDPARSVVGYHSVLEQSAGLSA